MGYCTRIIVVVAILFGVVPAIQAGGTEGVDNTLLGDGAGASLTTGIDNTFIGVNAGNAVTSETGNTFVGDQAGEANTASDNTFVGSSAGFSNTTAFANTFIGEAAGFDNTSGVDNTFVGQAAGLSNTTAFANTFIGEAAGSNNTTGAQNTFVGQQSGTSNTTGAENTFLGENAGFSNTTGFFNTFIGKDVGFSNTTGTRNTFIGEDAGRNNTTGIENTFLGENTGFNNTTGLNNLFVGKDAGFSSTGDGNVFLGTRAGADVQTSSNRLYIENSNASDPLIYGEFDNDILAVNGILGVGTQLPEASLHVRRSDGTANLLVEEANGAVTARQLYTLENNGPIGFGMVNSDSGDEWRFAAQTTGFRISLGGSGGQEFEVGNDGTLVVGPAGAANLDLDTSGNLTIQGTLTELSSRTAKEAIEAVDATAVLSRLAQLDLSRWSYTGQSARHLGPMAEDFHGAFGLGEDARHIAPKDLAGVALASTKALDRRTRRQAERFRGELEAREARIERLEAENVELRARLESLEGLKERMARIEAALPDQLAEVQ